MVDRNVAAHAGTVVSHVGDATQIWGVYYDGQAHKVETITMEDLKREARIARDGYEAAQTIGRALDDDRPGVSDGDRYGGVHQPASSIS